jgi:hypothetical protein
MGGSAVQRLGVRTHAAVESGAAHSLSPTEIDEGNPTTSTNSQVGKAIKAKRALELVETYFQYQAPGLNADESASIKTMQRALEARSSGFNILGSFGYGFRLGGEY